MDFIIPSLILIAGDIGNCEISGEPGYPNKLKYMYTYVCMLKIRTIY